MSVGDWGPDTEPAPSAPVGTDWTEAPEAPIWAFLPAVWPARHRAWLPAPPRFAETSALDSDWNVTSRTTVPWTGEDYETFDDETDARLGDAGVPPAPRGRRWFLQLPLGVESVDQLLDGLVERGAARGIDFSLDADFVAFVARDLPTQHRWGEAP